ncbi:N-acetylglucosamine-6-phosphate deacetylase [Parapedobacter tibetensis]|uniref:N-acetylglucosamine-6-phosphate deacetylase n=1 Tax=Parapedobacter tibetensis TaxID=2972951 RepID=UPI00214D2E97|nr:N-acetylglucosamine-6-phosphate deacetylase [Parapedobacter tibetensis]
MSERKIKIVNGTVITPYRMIKNGSVLITNGVITAINDADITAADAIAIDARGQYIAPGFIDIHVHGGGGHDFMDGSVAGFLKIAETHAHYGTTAMVPTTLTSDKGSLLDTLEVYEKAHRLNNVGSRFLGMHIEGPYFSLKQRGAQDARYIRDPDPAEYMEILEASSSIVRWSAAPEKAGAIQFGRVLRDRGILASVAHTDAVYDDMIEAFENGYTLATHLYSAMSGVSRRNAFRYGGAVESAFLIDEMDVEIIADGKHLPAELLKLVYKIKGPDRTALITDAMRAAAMPSGKSVLGSLHDGTEVLVEDGVAKMPDRKAFAGSVATANQLVHNMVDMADIPLIDAVRMATATPARIMGLGSQMGGIAVGKQADIVIFDKHINIHTTMVGGSVVYQREQTTWKETI